MVLLGELLRPLKLIATWLASGRQSGTYRIALLWQPASSAGFRFVLLSRHVRQAAPLLTGEPTAAFRTALGRKLQYHYCAHT
jgi:hypothetical protein